MKNDIPDTRQLPRFQPSSREQGIRESFLHLISYKITGINSTFQKGAAFDIWTHADFTQVCNHQGFENLFRSLWPDWIAVQHSV